MADEFSAASVEVAAILVSVLGKKRALAVLEPERPDKREYGVARAVDAIRNKFWDGIPTSMTDVEAEALLTRLDATPLVRAGRAQDFDDFVEEVYAAIVSGTAEAQAVEERKTAQAVTAGKFDPPAAPNSGDPVADLKELDAWKEALEAWRGSLTVEVARRFPRMPWEMFDEAKAETLKRAEAWLVAQMKSAADLEAAKAIVAKVKVVISGEVLRKGLVACPWAWDLVLADEYLVMSWDLHELPAPTPEAMARIPEGKILEWAQKAGAVWCGAELLRRHPMAEGQVTIVGKFRILPGGKVEEQVYDVPVQFQGKPLSTKPAAEGWFQTGKNQNRFFGPEFYQAYVRLSKAQRGAVGIDPKLFRYFNHHPQKGYPRFSFSVSAGAHDASFELPVWRPQEGKGWLAQRLDDLKAFVYDWHLPVPEEAFWLDVQVGTTAKGNPRLEPTRPGQQPVPAVLVYNEWSKTRAGRHGFGEIPPSAKEVSGSARIVWSATPSTAGLHHHAELLWIPKGGSITLDSGAVLAFDGEKVLSSAATGSDPSRES